VSGVQRMTGPVGQIFKIKVIRVNDDPGIEIWGNLAQLPGGGFRSARLAYRLGETSYSLELRFASNSGTGHSFSFDYRRIRSLRLALRIFLFFRGSNWKYVLRDFPDDSEIAMLILAKV
jgi:hypothetical protein